MKVKIKKLIKIIQRQDKEYTEERIKEIIEEYGADYFNDDIKIKYLGFGTWEVIR